MNNDYNNNQFNSNINNNNNGMNNQFNNAINNNQVNTNANNSNNNGMNNQFNSNMNYNPYNQSPQSPNQTFSQPSNSNKNNNNIIKIVGIAIAVVVVLFIAIKLVNGGSKKVYNTAGDTIDKNVYDIGETIKVNDGFSLKISNPKKVTNTYFNHNYFEFKLNVTNNNNSEYRLVTVLDSKKAVALCTIHSNSINGSNNPDDSQIFDYNLKSGDYYAECMSDELQDATRIAIEVCDEKKCNTVLVGEPD